jgi:hypothetical protein
MSESTAIILRIAADRTQEFEAMFEAEEISIWDDYTAEGLFLEASLSRVGGGSEEQSGIQDYILRVVAADHAAHSRHDNDPRFNAFLEKRSSCSRMDRLADAFTAVIDLPQLDHIVWGTQGAPETTQSGSGAEKRASESP